MTYHREAAASFLIVFGLGCSSPGTVSDAAADSAPTGDLKPCSGPKNPGHYAIDPADGKCKPDGTTTNVGAPCSAADPAGCGTFDNASCLDEQLDFFPGGYCNVDPCTASDDHLCPIGSSCVQLEGENGQCFKNCSTDGDCRTKQRYFCLDMTPDDRPGGLWISGASHKVCARADLTCSVTPNDCPAALPNCRYPGGGEVWTADGGMLPPPDAADGATILPACTK